MILGMIEDALDDDPISEAEERRIVERAERNEAESTRLYTHEEFWTLADKIPYRATASVPPSRIQQCWFLFHTKARRTQWTLLCFFDRIYILIRNF